MITYITDTRNGSTEHIVPTSVAPSMAPPPTGSLPISPTPYPVQFGQIPLGQTYPPSQYPAYPPPPITSGVQPAPTAQVAYPQPVPPAYTAPVYTSPTIIQPVAYPVPSYPPQPVYMSPANQTSGMYNPAPISSGPQVHAIPQTVTSSNSGLRTAAIGESRIVIDYLADYQTLITFSHSNVQWFWLASVAFMIIFWCFRTTGIYIYMYTLV